MPVRRHVQLPVLAPPVPAGAPPSPRARAAAAPPSPAQARAHRELAAELARTTTAEVRFDAGARALYATDLSIYRQVPIGVVIPRSVDDVVATVRACRERDVPILGRGAGTSLEGQTCNVAVVIDFSKHLNRILAIDPDRRIARVQPGVICDQLRDAVTPHGLMFAPDPATHQYCTLGGMIGNNSCGPHSVLGGRTADNVERLEVLTYGGLRLEVGATSDLELERAIAAGGERGRLYAALRAIRDRYAPLVRARYPQIPRRVSGYNLDELLPERRFHVARALVGTESTCAITLEAELRLIDNPPCRALLVCSYPTLGDAGDHVAELRALGPIALEAFHEHVIENMLRKGEAAPGKALLPPGHVWLLVELAGRTQDEANAAAERARDVARRRLGALDARVFVDPAEQKLVWSLRENCVGSTYVPSREEAYPGWDDAAVAPARLGSYLRGFEQLLDRFGYAATIYGHFGDGCVHSRIVFDPHTAEGVARWREFVTAAAELVLAHGGSLSGEHGDGQAHGEQLVRMFGSELVQAFRELKSAWDPRWRMNPGKVIDAYRLDDNLRLGPDYRPQDLPTHFHYPDDQGSFAKATQRCFGVGRCRRLEGGTMCPSFQVTREEMHTTRGRAHLLFELSRGDAIGKDGWREDAVKEALDLCLACKGCKGDCPASVDIATYKAEFLAHYWEGRWRPRQAYAMGLIDRWSQLASLAPGLVNLAAQTPGLAALARHLAGIAPARALPAFAPVTFRSWFARRPAAAAGGRPVVLWADTFTNYFQPDVAIAAVEVLEAAGCRVIVPAQRLCCGRPLYDYGMLDRARRYLEQALAALAPHLAAGTPVVVLEPSCAAVFRDELPNLMAHDADARRLSAQVVLLGELLRRLEPRLPRLARRALFHGHCHQKAVLGIDSDREVLEALGLELEVMASGCCGMAGSFGYERDKYEVSIACGEQVLLPQVRQASLGTLIVADGFSCREQIAHGTQRHALHLAQVLQLAARFGERGPAGLPVERYVVEPRHAAQQRSAARAAAGVAGLAALAGLVVGALGR